MSEKTLIASFVAQKMSPITCSVAYDGYFYLGGADGTVYKTVDGSYYDEFWRIDDGPIISIIEYGQALFVGTSPYGNVHMHNFSTNNRFHSVITGDDSVSSMEVHSDILYVATAQSGIILSFNGDEWNKEYESLRSISSMSSFGGKFYVFFEDANSVLVYDGNSWNFLLDAKSLFSVGSKAVVDTTIVALSGNNQAESGVGHSCVMGGKLYFTGVDRPTLYSYNGSSVVIEHQFGGGKITSLDSSESQVFVSINQYIYVNVTEDVSDG